MQILIFYHTHIIIPLHKRAKFNFVLHTTNVVSFYKYKNRKNIDTICRFQSTSTHRPVLKFAVDYTVLMLFILFLVFDILQNVQNLTEKSWHNLKCKSWSVFVFCDDGFPSQNVGEMDDIRVNISDLLRLSAKTLISLWMVRLPTDVLCCGNDVSFAQ